MEISNCPFYWTHTSRSNSRNSQCLPNTSKNKPATPNDSIGLGAYIKTTLYGFSAIIDEKEIPTGSLTKIRYYRVRHGELGGIRVHIYRLIHLTKYSVSFYVPSNLKVWTNSLSGAHLVDIKQKGSVNVITVENNSRFTAKISMGITFNSGYGKHGIITVGHMSTSVLQSVIMSWASAGSFIAGFVTTGATSLWANAVSAILLLASGASIDAIVYEEV